MKMDHLDLRSLQCFVTVAEELNFAKAARRLNLSQPPLTKRIKILEQQLGVTLFERTTRTVRLTPAGSLLLGEARRLLEHSLALQRSIRHADRPNSGTLRIGFVTTAFLAVALPHLRKLTQQLGSVEYVWSELTAPEQVIALRNMQLDLALIHTPLDYPGLASSVLVQEHFLAALPEEHRLATRSHIALKELASEPFAFFPRDIAPGYHDMVLAACRDAGFSLRAQHHPQHFLALIMLPASGCGVSLIPASAAARLVVPGVKLVPIRSKALRSDLMLLWNPANNAAILHRALHAIQARFKSHSKLLL